MTVPVANRVINNRAEAAPTLEPSLRCPATRRLATHVTTGFPTKLMATAARKYKVNSLKRHTNATKSAPASHHSHRILLMASSPIWG